MENIKRGKFIVFEGLDGSGKGTQINLLVQEMQKQGRKVFQTAEPTVSSVGGIIRDTLGGFQERDAYELSALFLADRIAHNTNTKNGIKQFLDNGIDVVCDRYYYSSFAYQGIDADLEWVMKLNLECKEILKPDICIFLDVDTENCDERISKNRLEREIYENKSTLERIRRRFFDVFEILKDSENIKIVDAARSVDEISADIIKIYKNIKEN